MTQPSQYHPRDISRWATEMRTALVPGGAPVLERLTLLAVEKFWAAVPSPDAEAHGATVDLKQIALTVVAAAQLEDRIAAIAELWGLGIHALPAYVDPPEAMFFDCLSPADFLEGLLAEAILVRARLDVTVEMVDQKFYLKEKQKSMQAPGSSDPGYRDVKLLDERSGEVQMSLTEEQASQPGDVPEIDQENPE